jgi:hypothetical protein
MPCGISPLPVEPPQGMKSKCLHRNVALFRAFSCHSRLSLEWKKLQLSMPKDFSYQGLRTDNAILRVEYCGL